MKRHAMVEPLFTNHNVLEMVRFLKYPESEMKKALK